MIIIKYCIFNKINGWYQGPKILVPYPNKHLCFPTKFIFIENKKIPDARVLVVGGDFFFPYRDLFVSYAELTNNSIEVLKVHQAGTIIHGGRVVDMKKGDPGDEEPSYETKEQIKKELQIA